MMEFNFKLMAILIQYVTGRLITIVLLFAMILCVVCAQSFHLHAVCLRQFNLICMIFIILMLMYVIIHILDVFIMI